jgi:diguanylate cyclase (GGDEF)-like protein
VGSSPIRPAFGPGVGHDPAAPAPPGWIRGGAENGSVGGRRQSFGSAPAWLHKAMGRSPILGEAMLSGVFHGEPVAQAELITRLTSAPSAALVEPKDQWLVAFILRTQLEWPDEDVSDATWLWCKNTERLLATERDIKRRVPAVDLAARALMHFVPNVIETITVRDRVFVSRNESFDDAFGLPEIAIGPITTSVRSTMQRLETILETTEVARVLENALGASVFPADMTRQDRFKAALQNDLFVDDGGSYGRYELQRVLQPMLLRATAEQPLTTMFIDMNGLKQINDELGHEAGDVAIAEFRAAVRREHSGMLFRTGGDEFVMFALGTPEETIKIAERILKSVGSRKIGDLRVSASIGIVLGDNPLEEPRALIKRADHEMYRAKAVSRASTPRSCTMVVAGGEVAVIEPSV